MSNPYQLKSNHGKMNSMLSMTGSTAPQVERITIDAEHQGQRLDNFLVNKLKGVPKTRIYRIIRKGEVRINKGRAKPDYKLQTGDSVRIPPVRQSEPKVVVFGSRNERAASSILDHILFEDDGLLVINKPAGMAVHGGSGLSFGVIEAIRHLRGKEKTLELVHRLDRETSGCLMIAKSRTVLKCLHEQLQARTLVKIYWTLVQGQWKEGTVITAPLKKNQLSSGERFVKVATDGQPSETEFTVLERFSNNTLMEARPKTGRTHQIRVHAAFANHSIVGDEKYGDRFLNQQMKEKGLGRLFLHARQITFKLPDYKESLSIIAPLEESLTKGLARLTGG